MSELLKIAKNGKNGCMFCQATFKDKYKLQRHIQTSKKCIENRPTITYNCIWCSQSFILKDDLNKHYKKCEENKEQIHMDLMTKNNYMIEEKDKIIKDLQDKLYSLANKTTISNTTKNNYTVNLTCAKPFIFSRKRIVNLLKTTCNEKYMLQGEIGTAKWFIDKACINNEGKKALQTTDRRRKILKYIDEREDIKQTTGNQLKKCMIKCLNDYRKTPQYNAIANKIHDTYKEADFSKLVKADEFMRPNGKFINYVCDETYDHSNFIEDENPSDNEDDTINDISGGPWVLRDDINDDYEDDIIEEAKVEPCFKEHFPKPVRSIEYDKFYD